MKRSAHELRRRGVLLVEQGGRGGVADYTNCLANAARRPRHPDHGRDCRRPPVRPVSRGADRRPRSHTCAGTRAPARLAAPSPPRTGPQRTPFPRWRLPALFRARARQGDRPHPGLGAQLARVDRDCCCCVRQAPRSSTPRTTRSNGCPGRPTASSSSRRSSPTRSCTRAGDRDADPPRPGVGHPARHIRPARANAPTRSPPRRRGAVLGLPADALVVLLFGVLRPDKGLGDLLRGGDALVPVAAC